MKTVVFTKYRDVDGNVYSVERSARNGRWIVIRTNSGGNRKIARRFPDMGNAGAMQAALNDWAQANPQIEAAGSTQ
jgi:hypothetical protein